MKHRAIGTVLALALAACTGEAPEPGVDAGMEEPTSALPLVNKGPRYALLRDAALARGLRTGYLFAGIANDETGLAMCWSEATWACQGPGSPACGGGPIIAGSADGPCSAQQGGLGMFQFDAGTYADTLNRYGASVLTIDGQIEHAVAFVTHIVKISIYTTNAETDAKARAWIANFDINNATLRDQWIKTLVHYYNGCASPSWSCWGPRYQSYTDGLWLALNETGGVGYWASGGGTRCGSSPAAVGAIDEKYRALGGCGSFLGAPITEERRPPDNVGRYSVFERGSIYWKPDTGAHEVYGRIRDKWAELGWETSVLGYPTSGEYAVSGGRRSDFQHGSITWSASTGVATAVITP